MATTKNATAPYNFISLPNNVLTSEINSTETFINHIQQRGNYSGEIKLEIETKTPLFIGNGVNSFAPVGKPIIAGSSLRGMFKNIFKIVTCGAFRGQTNSQRKGEDFNDEHVYYRCLMASEKSPAWMNDLNKLYTNRMTTTNDKGKPVKKARPGFLIQTADNKYHIAPSKYKTDRKDDRKPMRDYLRQFHIDKSCVTWDGDRAYIFTGAGGKKRFVRYIDLDYIDLSKNHWYDIPPEVLDSYNHDRNRKGVDLFNDKGIRTKNLPAGIKSLIPCHFLCDDNKNVTAFGHGQCFRIPYKKSIGDAVPANIKSEEIIDFADAVFGRENFCASRIYFEDAVPATEIRTLDKAKAHALMQPNPTSYQLYLAQYGGKLKHWDSANAKIRGYKMYWHNAIENWRASPSEIDEDNKRIADNKTPLLKDITPIDKGSKFSAKIRFQNLSEVELGALMMLFDLNGAKNAAYKIGMGKAFGFGSIKIAAELYIETADAYDELFDDNGWKSPYRAESPAKYLAAFKKHIDDNKMTDTWRNVMKELNTMLDWSNTGIKNWSNRIKQIPSDFKDKDNLFMHRAKLPPISEVVK